MGSRRPLPTVSVRPCTNTRQNSAKSHKKGPRDTMTPTSLPLRRFRDPSPGTPPVDEGRRAPDSRTSGSDTGWDPTPKFLWTPQILGPEPRTGTLGYSTSSPSRFSDAAPSTTLESLRRPSPTPSPRVRSPREVHPTDEEGTARGPGDTGGVVAHTEEELWVGAGYGRRYPRPLPRTRT